MNFLLIYKMALHSIWENKTRSFLTMLGVIIGVAAVIVAVAFAEGSMETITNRVENMGANSITAMITSTSASRTLTLDKLEKFERDCVYIESISPYMTLNSDVKYKSESKTTRIFGTDERYLEIDGMNIERGRFITALDIEKNEKVAVIGSAVDKKLFGGIDAIGEYIKINGSKFLVVGIIESVANGIEGTNDDMVCIPITVAQRTLKITNVTMFLANATSTDTVNLANQKIGKEIYTLDIYGSVGENFQEEFNNLLKDNKSTKYCGVIDSKESVKLLKKYDFLIFPTYYDGEGLAGTLIDSFFSGTPSIASNWKYNGEVITDQKNGFLFETKNDEEATKILLDIYNKKYDLEQISKNCIMEAEKYLPVNAIKGITKYIK